MAIEHGTDGRRSIWRVLLAALRSLRGPIWPGPVPEEGHKTLECPLCHANFLCPTDWGTADEARWWVLSRCGECDVWSEIFITNAQAARLDRELDRQQMVIERAAARLEAERMAAEAETFIHALQSDLIDAADFA